MDISSAPYLISALVIAVMMGFVWLISIPLKDVSIVDSFWGFGFGLSSLGVFLLSDGMKSTAQIILLTVVIVWSLRLGGYLFWRWSQEEEEDGRYQAMRKKRPLFWLQSIYIVFIFQGLLMWVIALPVTHTLAFNHTTTEPVTPLALFGLVVALAGLIIETISDWQLVGFRANPDNQGKILETGLWGRSRHPNYFGDATFWWGVWIICCAISPLAVYFVFAPAMMNYLIVKISGADLLDKILAKRKPGYEEYMARTNRFIPKFF
ncbi:MAG: DUF1295 domain-containing protein [Parvibaculales bacterium]